MCHVGVIFRQLSDTGTVELKSGETHLGLSAEEGCNSKVCESYTGEFLKRDLANNTTDHKRGQAL